MTATRPSPETDAIAHTGAVGCGDPAEETPCPMGDVDFSRVNLQYLICARDLARDYPKRAAVLLGVSEEIGELLATLDAEALVAVTQIKAPLLIPCQEPWWWKRLLTALQSGGPDELRAVLEQAGLMVAKDGPRGADTCA